MSNTIIIPEVGQGATQLCWSDRHPYTIVQVINRKKIIVQADKEIYVQGSVQYGTAEYKYEANPNGVKVTVSLRHNNRWVTQGENAKTGTAFAIGYRRYYYDPSF